MTKTKFATTFIEETDNDIIESCQKSLLTEAIAFFNTPFARTGTEMSRYFYKMEEVNYVLSHVRNPEQIKIETIKEDDGQTIFCWELIKKIVKGGK